MLTDHLAAGLSYTSFGGIISVDHDTLLEWEKRHPEFSGAKKAGRARQLVFYEKLGIKAAQGDVENFNSTAFVWMTKNMLGWRDQQNIEHSGKISIQDLIVQSNDEKKE